MVRTCRIVKWRHSHTTSFDFFFWKPLSLRHSVDIITSGSSSVHVNVPAAPSTSFVLTTRGPRAHRTDMGSDSGTPIVSDCTVSSNWWLLCKRGDGFVVRRVRSAAMGVVRHVPVNTQSTVQSAP